MTRSAVYRKTIILSFPGIPHQPNYTLYISSFFFSIISNSPNCKSDPPLFRLLISLSLKKHANFFFWICELVLQGIWKGKSGEIGWLIVRWTKPGELIEPPIFSSLTYFGQYFGLNYLRGSWVIDLCRYSQSSPLPRNSKSWLRTISLPASPNSFRK